jgi:hypothetical protein
MFSGLKTCRHPKINHPRFFSLLCNVLKDLDHSVRGIVELLCNVLKDLDDSVRGIISII